MDLNEIREQKKIVLEIINEISPCTIPEVASISKLPIDIARQWVLFYHSKGVISSDGSKVCFITNSRLSSYKLKSMIRETPIKRRRD